MSNKEEIKMESKICPYCKMTIPKRATKCPYCQERIGFANEMVKFGNALIWLGIFIFIFLLIFCLLGCISIDLGFTSIEEKLTDPNWIAARITIERDDFRKMTIFRGPWIEAYLGDGLRLCAYKKADLEYQIYLQVNPFSSWHSYDYAYDSDGKKLWMTSQFRPVVSWIVQDCFISVSKKYLQNHSSSGIRFKLYPEEMKEKVFFIPPAYIQAFLSVTEDVQN